MGKYIVFDSKGIIHESDDEEAARQEYKETTDFTGDLIFCEVKARRR
jgi:hypothetical protein